MDPCADEFLTSEEPDDRVVRQLVLDYLIHNCYGETAKVFFKDSQDLSTATSKEDNYSNGCIKNGKFPNGNSAYEQNHKNETDAEGDLEMTDPNLEGYIHVNAYGNSLSQDTSKLLMLLGNKQNSKSGFDVEFALKSLGVRKQIREYIIAGNIPAALLLCQATFPKVVAVDEDDLATSRSTEMRFKLHLQQFIETVRAGNSEEALMFALTELRKYTEHGDPNEKKKYRDSLDEVISIIAYTEPENSPSAKFFAQTRRDQLADEINSMILSYDNQMNESALERIIKQATVVREYLHNAMSKGQKTSKVYAKWQLSTFIQEGS
ncbi:16211_t:CDS:2 [Acaulospora morrowiae]|uniref:16211_t:CDS:1 n=1 Tax=Acaulospora morrowiae TaxID=94023 RepID=A0A9N9ETJ8_9GLOM|nr:16211_t:CDS:2 [Acaulospora morrowiae]